ncbi:MAG: sodium:proton antiporter [Thiovulaceae bacterium]|nr:sodium:proton antiporter [Sulfurimonadaceae bacterium]
MEPTIISLLPPVIAIVLALLTKRVLFSLFIAVISAELIFADGDILAGFSGSLDLFVTLFQEAWIIYTLFFALLVGSIIKLLENSNAVYAFIESVTIKHNLVKSKRSALFVGFFTGVVIFIESSLTALIVATVTKPFANKYKISKEKIAYLCDTTASPICSIIPINGWGALLIGLFTTVLALMEVKDIAPVELLFQSVLFNFYAFISLIVLGWAIYTDKDLGAMKHIHSIYPTIPADKKHHHRLRDFFVPIILLLGFLFLALYITGEGNLLKGDGSKSLFISVTLTLVGMFFLYVPFGFMDEKSFGKSVWQGVFDLAPVVAILLFAFMLAHALQAIGTAVYLGNLLNESITIYLIPALIFLLSGVIAFATGSSWGTFSIMVPIAAASIDPSVLPLALVMGAVLSGGVFGDHASPISDTTILASLAAQSDHINHVKTQMPYATISAGISFILFIVATVIVS